MAIALLLLAAGCGGGGGGGGAPANQPPVASAGSDQLATENAGVALAGSGTDSDGSIAGYQWQQIAGPAVSLSNASSASAGFTAPAVSAPTAFTFRLTVTDNGGTSSSDDVVITVLHTLFADDFSGGLNWTPTQDTGIVPTWSLSSGELHQSTNVEPTSSFTQSYHRGTYAWYAAGTSLTDYRFRVDVTFLSTGLANDIGVMFRYQDIDNYYRLSLNSRYGFSRLEKKVTGTFTPLASNARGYRAGQTHNITVDGKGTLIQIFLDGDPLFAVNDSDLASGSVALYTQDNSKFDNVLIQSTNPAPAVVLEKPLAHSVITGTPTIAATAQASNVPAGGYVEFLLDGTTSQVASAAPFNATFAGVASGEHTVAAILRDAGGAELARDTNIKVGVQGNMFVAIGDSITNGDGDNFATDSSSADGRVLAFQGYEAVLGDLLTTTLGIPNVVVNEGIGGDKSADAATLRIDSILARNAGANKVLVLLGTNDALSGTVSSGNGCSGAGCSGTFKGNMQTLISKITASGKQVWVAKVPPMFDSVGTTINTSTILDYNTVITGLSGSQVGPDFYNYFLNRFSLFADTLHPNALGHAAIAALWRDTLTGASAPFFVLNNLTPSTSVPYLKQNLLEVGDRYYVDLPTTTLSTIPSALANGRWVMTANADAGNNSASYMTFNVDRPATVYIAYDAGATSVPDWLSTFADTGLTVGVSGGPTPTFKLYSRAFAVGPVNLGGNLAAGANGADSHYLVIVVAN